MWTRPRRSGFNGIMTKALRWAGAVVATAVALAVCVALGQLAYQIYEIYGAEQGAGVLDAATVLNALPFVLPAAPHRRRRDRGRLQALAGRPARQPRFLALAGLSLVLSCAIVAVGAWTGTQAKQQGWNWLRQPVRPRKGMRCRPWERCRPTAPTGTGMTDGSCQGVIAFIADAQADARLAAVREALGRRAGPRCAGDSMRPTSRTVRTWR